MIKKQITLVITDSGLGGLSVCAGMAAKFVGDARYDRIHLVYFNAWSEQDKGTGTIRIRRPGPRCLTMPGSHSPIQPRSHLHCLQHPVRDLSVYPVCKRDGNSCHRHCGPWVQMIYDALIRDASASVVVFAPPPITIHENSHKAALVDRGIVPERIITQGYLGLACEIDRAPFSNEVKAEIDKFAAQAAQNLNSADPTVYKDKHASCLTDYRSLR